MTQYPVPGTPKRSEQNGGFRKEAIWYVQCGAPVNEIAELVYHSNTCMVYDTYSIL